MCSGIKLAPLHSLTEAYISGILIKQRVGRLPLQQVFGYGPNKPINVSMRVLHHWEQCIVSVGEKRITVDRQNRSGVCLVGGLQSPCNVKL